MRETDDAALNNLPTLIGVAKLQTTHIGTGSCITLAETTTNPSTLGAVLAA